MTYKLDVRLHTRSLSLFSGRNTTLLHAVSVTKLACGGVNVRKQSVERTSQICDASTAQVIGIHKSMQQQSWGFTLTVLSLLDVAIVSPSCENLASLTYDVWPLNSFSNLPERRPCILH